MTVTDEAHPRIASYRALNQFTCPTCQRPPGELCQTRTGRPLHGQGLNHKRREALLWSEPCPTCGAGVAEFCPGRPPGVNHRERDEAIHAANPGSELYPVAETISYREASRRPDQNFAAFPTITRWEAAAGRAPWHTAD